MPLPPESASRVVREPCEGAVVSLLRYSFPVVSYRGPWGSHLSRVDHLVCISLALEGGTLVARIGKSVFGWY